MQGSDSFIQNTKPTKSSYIFKCSPVYRCPKHFHNDEFENKNSNIYPDELEFKKEIEYRRDRRDRKIDR